MVRRALVLLLLLIVAVAPVISGCSDNAAGPGPDGSEATDNVPAETGPTEPEPTDPGPTEPGPTEPTGPTSPEFPRGLFGTVFDDVNANGVRDAGEPGLKDVLVSNGIACRPTDGDGRYNLPSDNSLVFVTVPGDRTSTGAWYAVPSTDNIDFGVRQTPGKGAADFTFIQVTDLHAGQEQAHELAGLASDINALSPAFVVATGDLINEGNGATIPAADWCFGVYQGFSSGLGMPVYQAVGNHDVVGIYRSDADTADPGYGKGMFVSRFGPTYYSFDWGRHHCIVLDPNDMEDGRQVYRIPEAQLEWLADDLSYRDGAPLLVFFHEPSTSWVNRAEVLDLFEGRSAELFCGHLHQGVTLDSGGIPEHITAAVCGEWWRGPNPDGRPQGYRLVSVRGDGVESLYMGTGDNRTVDFGLSPLVSGPVDLAVKIYSRSAPAGTTGGVSAGVTSGASAGVTSGASAGVTGGASAGVTSVTCVVDHQDNQTLAMTLEDRGAWSVAAASWDTAPLAEGYHHLTLRVTDAAGTFEERFDFKKSEAETVSLSDLTGHRDVFWGHCVLVRAPVFLLLTGPMRVGGSEVPEGMGLLVLKDGSDMLIVVAGELISPPLSGGQLFGREVIVKVVPVRLSMTQLISSAEWDAYYPLIETYLGGIPASALEPPDAASITDLVAVWGARWLSADDLTPAPGRVQGIW